VLVCLLFNAIFDFLQSPESRGDQTPSNIFALFWCFSICGYAAVSSDGLTACLSERRHLGKRTHVVRSYDDRLGQTFFECDHAQQVFAVALRIRIGPSAGDPGAFMSPPVIAG